LKCELLQEQAKSLGPMHPGRPVMGGANQSTKLTHFDKTWTGKTLHVPDMPHCRLSLVPKNTRKIDRRESTARTYLQHPFLARWKLDEKNGGIWGRSKFTTKRSSRRQLRSIDKAVSKPGFDNSILHEEYSHNGHQPTQHADHQLSIQ